MRIKLLPGILSYLHIFELFVYFLIVALFLIPNIFLIGIFVTGLSSVLIFRIFYFFELQN